MSVWRGASDALRLTEDLHLDSLGRVQLQSALESRMGVEVADDAIASVGTVGELRGLVAGSVGTDAGSAAEQQVPFGNDRKKSNGKGRGETRIPFGNDKQREVMQSFGTASVIRGADLVSALAVELAGAVGSGGVCGGGDAAAGAVAGQASCGS